MHLPLRRGFFRRPSHGDSSSITSTLFRKMTLRNYTKYNATTRTFYPHLELPEKVPRLPIPDLKDTMNRYLETIHPIVTPQQYEAATNSVKEFMTPSIGPSLQEELIQFDSDTKNVASYIEGLWDTMYLELRCPNPINVSPVFLLNFDMAQARQSVSGHELLSQREIVASKLIEATAYYHQQIETPGALPFDTIGRQKQPICMSQFRNLFATARIPHPNRDRLVKYVNSTHVIVLVNNQFYRLEVFKDNHVVSLASIEKQLFHIKEHSSSVITEPGDCLGVLTAEDRNRWAGIRQNFSLLSQKNQSFLEDVDSAIAIFVLDDTNIETLKQSQEWLIAGNHRWYDKLQIIISNNGWAGVNMEHTGFDGHTLLSFAGHVKNHISEKNSSSSTKTTTFEYLTFDTNPDMKLAIGQANQNIEQFAQSTDHSVLLFEDFGKKSIVKHQIGPDSFVQMAFQLAHYKLEGKIGSTYESAMTKRFYHGRTETIRSVTDESVDMCHKLTNFTNRATAKELSDSIRLACESQSKRAILANEGQGVDRHLFALHAFAKHRQQRLSGYDIPKLYLDDAYAIMKTDLLSTSNCSSENVQLFGFGATSAEGYGLGYVIGNDNVSVGISSYKGRAGEMKEAIEESMRELKKVLEEA